MNGRVFRGAGMFTLEECPSPTVQAAGDAILRVSQTTIQARADQRGLPVIRNHRWRQGAGHDHRLSNLSQQ
jgi:hypothetical protein